MKRQEAYPLIVTGLILLFFPFFTRNPYYLNVANIVALNGVVVIGLTLLIRHAGQISLGHGTFL